MMYRVIPVVFVLLAIALFVLYINPMYTVTIAGQEQQIQSFDSALSAAQKFTQKENELVADENSIPANELSRLTTYLPDGVDNVQLIVDLNALAARSGLTLSNFVVQNSPTSAASSGSSAPTSATVTPSDSTQTTDTTDTTNTTTTGSGPGTLQSTALTNYLDLSVSATGTYSAFKTFLTAAEQSLRPLDVTEISVNDSTTGVYTYQITFRIYWLQ